MLELIRQDVRLHLEQANADERRVVNEIQSRLSETSVEVTKLELDRLTARLAELESLGANLYEDMLDFIPPGVKLRRLILESGQHFADGRLFSLFD